MNREWSIWIAAKRGDAEGLAEIVDGGTDVNIQNLNSETSLHLASANGHLKCVKVLLKRNAYVNAVDRYKMSPLHYACEGGHLEIAKYLVYYGAYVINEDESGKSPMDVAREMNNTELISFLESSQIEIACDLGCGIKMKSRSLHLHKEKDCMKRIVDCPRLCGVTTTKDAIEYHMKAECCDRYLHCPKDCGMMLRFGDVDKHLVEFCINNVCALCPIGCKVLCKEMELHNQQQHLAKAMLDWNALEVCLWLENTFKDISASSIQSYKSIFRRVNLTGRILCILDYGQMGQILGAIGISTLHRKIISTEIGKRKKEDGSQNKIENENGIKYMPVARGTVTAFTIVGDIPVDKTVTLRRIRPKLVDLFQADELFPNGFSFVTFPEGVPLSREKEAFQPCLCCGGCIIFQKSL